MKEYKRVTFRNKYNQVEVYNEFHDREPLQRLAELEDKIENGTLVFRKKPKKKYWAIIGYRNCCGKFGYHIEYASIEYEKEPNQVAMWVNGSLFVTRKDLLFTNKAKAEVKLKEIKSTMLFEIANNSFMMGYL